MLMLDATLIILSLIVAYATKWHPFTPDRLRLTGALVLASLLALLFAAGAVGGFRDMLAGGIGRGPETPYYRDHDFFAQRRMIFFYAGVNLKLLTFAVLVEQTGGITSSPYIGVFFAFILTGQQLSRFRTQSTCLIAAGAVLTTAMWAYETTAGKLKSPAPPATLTLLLVITTFIACGLMTNYEKDHNYLVQGKEKDLPTQAHVYRDVHGVWHYVIYRRRHRLDPIVDHSAVEEAGTGKTLTAVQDRVQAIISSMYQEAAWDLPEFRWLTSDRDGELIVHFADKSAIAPSSRSLRI